MRLLCEIVGSLVDQNARNSISLLAASQVTKRSFEEPQPGSFGSSEYRRVG
jgi:hypothetical protein